MTPIDKGQLLAWTTRLVALRAAAKGTSMYDEALALKADLMERAEKRADLFDSENQVLDTAMKPQISTDDETIAE